MSAEDLLSQFPEDERGLPEFAWPGGYTMAYVNGRGGHAVRTQAGK